MITVIYHTVGADEKELKDCFENKTLLDKTVLGEQVMYVFQSDEEEKPPKVKRGK